MHTLHAHYYATACHVLPARNRIAGPRTTRPIATSTAALKLNLADTWVSTTPFRYQTMPTTKLETLEVVARRCQLSGHRR